VYLKVLQEMQQVIMGGGVRMHQEVGCVQKVVSNQPNSGHGRWG
jgi:hypothetical protein